METIGKRVRFIRKDNHMTQKTFSEVLGVTEAIVLNIELNRLKHPESQEPIYRLISEKFNVNLEWLKTGEGEIYKELSRDDRIVNFVEKVMGEEDDSFKKRFIAVLSAFDDDEWQLLEKIAEAVHNGTPINDVADQVIADNSAAKNEVSEELDIDAAVEEYRRQLELEKKAKARLSASNE